MIKTWSEEEDELLIDTVRQYRAKDWKKIANCVPGRTYIQCLHRWQIVLNPDLVKDLWSEEEDITVIELVGIYGTKKWSVIAQHLPGRIGKQCRERWTNYLDLSIDEGI